MPPTAAALGQHVAPMGTATARDEAGLSRTFRRQQQPAGKALARRLGRHSAA